MNVRKLVVLSRVPHVDFRGGFGPVFQDDPRAFTLAGDLCGARAQSVLFALGLTFRHAMDSVVLRRLQPINQSYGNLIWKMTQMFVEGQLGRM